VGGLQEVIRNPRYATGVGLLLAGLEQYQRHQLARLTSSSWQQILERMKAWFQGF